MIGELGMVIGIGGVGASILFACLGLVVCEWSWSKAEEAVEQEQEQK